MFWVSMLWSSLLLCLYRVPACFLTLQVCLMIPSLELVTCGQIWSHLVILLLITNLMRSPRHTAPKGPVWGRHFPIKERTGFGHFWILVYHIIEQSLFWMNNLWRRGSPVQQVKYRETTTLTTGIHHHTANVICNIKPWQDSLKSTNLMWKIFML